MQPAILPYWDDLVVDPARLVGAGLFYETIGTIGSVGIRDANGQNTGNVLQWSYNQQVLRDNQAICFSAGGTACKTAVPEPTTIALLSLGLIGLGFTRRKMKA